MKVIKYLSLRVDHWQHGLWHLAHGILPFWGYAEGKVDSPDFDHIPKKGRFNVKGYFAHLKMNYRCYRRHKVIGRFQYMEVTFK